MEDLDQGLLDNREGSLWEKQAGGSEPLGKQGGWRLELLYPREKGIEVQHFVTGGGEG